jgi:hypothetical protein
MKLRIRIFTTGRIAIFVTTRAVTSRLRRKQMRMTLGLAQTQPFPVNFATISSIALSAITTISSSVRS